MPDTDAGRADEATPEFDALTSDETAPEVAAAPGRDARRTNRLLVRAIWLATVVLLAFTAFIVWQVTGTQKAPRVLTPAESKAEEIRAALKKDPKNPQLHTDLGEMLYVMGDHDEARKEFNAALKYRKDFGPAVGSLAAMDWLAGNRDKAVAALKAHLVKQDADYEIWYQLGTYQQEQELWSEAANSYTEALARNKGDAAALYRLGLCYEKLGKKEEALAKYRQAIKYVPDYEPALDALTRLGTSK